MARAATWAALLQPMTRPPLQGECGGSRVVGEGRVPELGCLGGCLCVLMCLCACDGFCSFEKKRKCA